MLHLPSHTLPSPTNQNPFPSLFGRSTGNSDYSYYKSEPAPIGITDFGFGPNGSRNYYTSSSFLGIAELKSLSTKNSTGDSTMSFQLNVNLQIRDGSNQTSHFWIQNVARLDTNSDTILITNDVWNQSSTVANLSDSAISGNGQLIDCGCPSNAYKDYAAFLPGASTHYSLPLMVELGVNASSNGGKPIVSFSYDDGFGWQVYDTVAFTKFSNISSSNVTFVVAPKYNPDGSFENAEFITGGAENGWNTTDLASDARLQLEFWNGHNYQQVYNAYNFGGDTAEGISNVVSSNFVSSNGSLAARLSPGSGTLGKLYDASKVSIISFHVPFASGTLYVTNSSSNISKNSTGSSFVGGLVNVTLSPGTYTFYLYSHDGRLQKNLSESIAAGENKAVNITSIALSSSTFPINLTSSVTLTTSFSNSSSLTSSESSPGTTISLSTFAQSSTSSTTSLLSSAPSASYDSQSIILLAVTATIILVLALATLLAVRRREK